MGALKFRPAGWPMLIYLVLECYLLGLTLVWCFLDLFCNAGGGKPWQTRYDVFYEGSVSAVLVLFVSLFFVWRTRRRTAVFGFAICLFWAVWAALPRI
jgi:hypothetical protein